MIESFLTVLAEGISVCPLRTQTLPPATHTNVYLLGTGEILIVDPGAEDPAEQQKLLSEIKALQHQGKTVRAVFLTHHHPDHTGGSEAVISALGVGVWCHRKTADRLSFPVERLFEDKDAIVLSGSAPLQFSVLHTPGHAKGHLTLVEVGSRAAIVGDMVAGLGTILIDPPEGNMADYLVQLQRLRDFPVAALYPAHGPPLADGPAALDLYIAHRLMREERVWNAVSKNESENSLEKIAARAYADSPTAHPFIAQRSTLAHLEKLVDDKKVAQSPTGGWFRHR